MLNTQPFIYVQSQVRNAASAQYSANQSPRIHSENKKHTVSVPKVYLNLTPLTSHRNTVAEEIQFSSIN